MAKNVYANALNTRSKVRNGVAQTEVIPGREVDMSKNSAGGYSFTVDGWGRLDRFLILGSEGGSYYATKRKLTEQNAAHVVNLVKQDGARVVDRIVEVSTAGRAPKNDPALFSLAVAMTHGDATTQRAAFDAIPKVARIGTHVFHLAEFVNGMRSWGRGVRRGFSGWYNGQNPMQLAMQLVKYANRDGWTHADVIRLAHPRPVSDAHAALMAYAVGKKKDQPDAEVALFLEAVGELKSTRDAKIAVKLISDHKLPREVVPTELLTEQSVWEALLPHMGIEAMIRNLATMTRVGLLTPFSNGSQTVLEKMANSEVVKRSRIHPIKVLAALMTYKTGHSVKGNNVWTPVQNIVAGLDDLFYDSFKNVVPTGKRILLALDVSGSMDGFWGTSAVVMGVPGLTPRIASAVMAAVTMRSEKMYEVVGFSTSLCKIPINAKMSLDEICNVVRRIPMGGTDCSLPMEWAIQNKVPVDAFVVYTDSETYAGRRHPSQALKAYRNAMGIGSRLIVNGMTANDFTIADPGDAGMLDVVGFDSAAPSLMADFIRGDF